MTRPVRGGVMQSTPGAVLQALHTRVGSSRGYFRGRSGTFGNRYRWASVPGVHAGPTPIAQMVFVVCDWVGVTTCLARVAPWPARIIPSARRGHPARPTGSLHGTRLGTPKQSAHTHRPGGLGLGLSPTSHCIGRGGWLRRGAGAIRTGHKVTRGGHGGGANRMEYQTRHLREGASAAARAPGALANRLQEPKVGRGPASHALGSKARSIESLQQR